jgi:hypothetical protein
MIDLDSIEVCHDCREPLMLLELARDVGQTFKATAIMRELAERSSVPAAVTFYLVDGSNDISRFRVRSVSPPGDHEYVVTPAQYARWLQSLRDRHTCQPRPADNLNGRNIMRSLLTYSR